MSVVCEDFKNLLSSYSNTITNNNLLFRISKECGYSQLVTVPCNKSYSHIAQPTIYSLLESIHTQMGEWTKNKIYYYPKNQEHLMSIAYDNPESVDNPYREYLHKQDIFSPLVTFSVNNFQTAYSVDQCQYAVYQLYVDTDCNHACVEKNEVSQTKEYPAETYCNHLDYVV